MKRILGLAFLLLATACEENVQSLKTLSDDEQDYIRNLSAAKCKTQSQPSFDKLKENSTDKMLELQEGDYWKIDKVGGTPSTTETTYIYVWKRNIDKIYLLIQEGTSSKRYSFLKLTTAFNEEVIQDLIEKKCLKTSDFVVTNSTSTLTLKRKDVSEPEPPDYFKSDYTHNLSSSYPAIVMNFLYSQSKKKLKESGSSTVVSTTSYTSKVVKTGEDFELEDSYTDYGSANFCLMNYTIDGTTKKFNYPYTMTCTTSTAGPTNPGADATLNFTPTTEL